MLLLDEPTAHLDADTEARVLRALCARARAGATVVRGRPPPPVLAIADRGRSDGGGTHASRSDPDWCAHCALLRPRLPACSLAIALGVLSLGSALALAGVSAWLITRAWQMPPVLDLTVAVVAVRAFGISRGVLRLLRAVGHPRHRPAGGRHGAGARSTRGWPRRPAAPLSGCTAATWSARVGADVDALADVLVRALVPIGVAVVLAVAATAVIALISPAAALVLAASPGGRRRARALAVGPGGGG